MCPWRECLDLLRGHSTSCVGILGVQRGHFLVQVILGFLKIIQFSEKIYSNILGLYEIS